MRKKILAMILAAILATGMVACEKRDSSTETSQSPSEDSDSQQESYNLCVITKSLSSSWMQAVKKGVLESAEALNEEAGYEKVKVSYVGPKVQSEIEDQVELLRDAISSGYDCIGLAALDPYSVANALADAKNAGIPVVGWDSGIPGAPEDSVVANISIDNYAAGEEAATELYAKVKERIGKGKQVGIGILSATSISNVHVERDLGFIDKFIELANADGKTVSVSGNEKIIKEVSAETVSERNADCVVEVRVPSQMKNDLISAEAKVFLYEKNMIGIFANTQEVVGCILDANEEVNVLGTDDEEMILMGFDAGAKALEAVRSGIMYGGINQAPYDIGKQTVEVMTKVCEGEEVEDISTEFNFYDADNLEDEEIAENLYE